MRHEILVSVLFIIGYIAFLWFLFVGMRAACRGRTQMPPEHETGDDVAPHLRSASLLAGRDDYTPPFVRPYRFSVGFPDEDDGVDDGED